jgi:hypothetical protein
MRKELGSLADCPSKAIDAPTLAACPPTLPRGWWECSRAELSWFFLIGLKPHAWQKAGQLGSLVPLSDFKGHSWPLQTPRPFTQ